RAAPQGGGEADGRRRRRRRRRGRTNGEATPGSGGLPSYTATPVSEGRRDNRDSAPRDSAPRDNRDSAPRDNAPRDSRDFDRRDGAVSLRQIAETAQRRGRLAGDAQLVQSQVAAAVRADNARRIAAGQRPRFRLAGGRVALTDWLLSGDQRHPAAGEQPVGE